MITQRTSTNSHLHITCHGAVHFYQRVTATAQRHYVLGFSVSLAIHPVLRKVISQQHVEGISTNTVQISYL